MKISKNNDITTIKMSESLIKELNDKINRIISDNALINPYSVDKVILSSKDNKIKFEIDLNNGYDEDTFEIEQIIHVINKGGKK